jgi:hypothetical protein
MPAPIDPALKEAIKASVIQHGVRPTAEAFQMPVGTVGYWSANEGWLKTEQPRQLPVTVQPSNGSNVKPSEAAATLLEKLGDKSRIRLAKGVYSASRAAAKLKPDAALYRSGEILTTARAGEKVFGWNAGAAQANPLISISISTPAELRPAAPVIDLG